MALKYPKLEALRILRYPDPRLRANAGTVREVDSFFKELAQRMDELMREAQGVGLAAPQVGLTFRFIVMNTTQEPGAARAFINPVILQKTGKVLQEEGCLSLPGIFAKINRAEKVRVRATLPDGEVIEMDADGLLARAWQHELDHLDGGLFVDRVGPAAKIMLRSQLKDLEKQFAESLPPDKTGKK